MRLSLSKDGRKYTMILLFGAVASVALFTGKASFPEWTYFMIPWGAFYLASNVGQRIGMMKAGANELTMNAEVKK
jgi:hypothetical protein